MKYSVAIVGSGSMGKHHTYSCQVVAGQKHRLYRLHELQIYACDTLYEIYDRQRRNR